MSVEELREFMRELVLETSLREAGKMIGRGHEMVRKFIGGEIERPQERTRRSIGELYLKRRQQANPPEQVQVGEPGRAELLQSELQQLLPTDPERAAAEIRTFFAEAHPAEEAPAWAPKLQELLLRWAGVEEKPRREYARKKRPPRKRSGGGEE